MKNNMAKILGLMNEDEVSRMTIAGYFGEIAFTHFKAEADAEMNDRDFDAVTWDDMMVKTIEEIRTDHKL